MSRVFAGPRYLLSHQCPKINCSGSKTAQLAKAHGTAERPQKDREDGRPGVQSPLYSPARNLAEHSNLTPSFTSTSVYRQLMPQTGKEGDSRVQKGPSSCGVFPESCAASASLAGQSLLHNVSGICGLRSQTYLLPGHHHQGCISSGSSARCRSNQGRPQLQIKRKKDFPKRSRST